MSRPTRLEINNSGSWKKLGSFDASGEQTPGTVMQLAVDLVLALNTGKPPKQCSSLRISMDDGHGAVLAYWTIERGCWFDAKTKEPI